MRAKTRVYIRTFADPLDTFSKGYSEPDYRPGRNRWRSCDQKSGEFSPGLPEKVIRRIQKVRELKLRLLARNYACTSGPTYIAR